jgi:hypothetical protein
LDDFINKNDLFRQDHHSKQSQQQPQYLNRTVERSITVKINNTNKNEPSKNRLLSKVTEADNNNSSRQSLVKFKSVTSSRSVYSLSFNENVNHEKTMMSSNNRNQNVYHEQLPSEAPDIDLHSDDQLKTKISIRFL